MKETFYFPHDCNSIQDPKLMELLSSCGLAGIGFYWIIIEILHQQDDGKISYGAFKKYIKFYCSFESSGEHMLNTIEHELITTKLLLKDGENIYSRRVNDNKNERKKLIEKRSFAGKKSAEARANQTSVEHVLNKGQQGKERKGKENNIVSKDTKPDGYGNERLNNFLDYVKKECNLADFAEPNGTVRQRGWNFLQWIDKNGKDTFEKKWRKLKSQQDLSKFRKMSTIYQHFKTIK